MKKRYLMYFTLYGVIQGLYYGSIVSVLIEHGVI